MMSLAMTFPQANAQGIGLRTGVMDTVRTTAKIITSPALKTVLTLAMSTLSVLASTRRTASALTGGVAPSRHAHKPATCATASRVVLLQHLQHTPTTTAMVVAATPLHLARKLVATMWHRASAVDIGLRFGLMATLLTMARTTTSQVCLTAQTRATRTAIAPASTPRMDGAPTGVPDRSVPALRLATAATPRPKQQALDVAMDFFEDL